MNFDDIQNLRILPDRILDVKRKNSELVESLEVELNNIRRRCDHKFETGIDARIFEEHVTFCQVCGLELWRDNMNIHEEDKQ